MITQDIRYGWRLMVRKPAFTLVAVLTLGLGIGANVTMFSWVDSTLQAPDARRPGQRPARRAQRHDAHARRSEHLVSRFRRSTGSGGPTASRI